MDLAVREEGEQNKDRAPHLAARNLQERGKPTAIGVSWVALIPAFGSITGLAASTGTRRVHLIATTSRWHSRVCSWMLFFSGLAKRAPSFSASHLYHLISLTTHSLVRLTTPGGRPAQTDRRSCSYRLEINVVPGTYKNALYIFVLGMHGIIHDQ